MGDDAVFHALRAGPFEAGWAQRAETGRAQLDAVLRSCIGECLLETLEAGWDLGSDLHDDSLDERLEGELVEAWQAIRAALLSSDACEWFGRLCDARDLIGGALSPQVLAELAPGLQTGALPALAASLEADDVPSGFAELHAFLERAAAAGGWVLWHSR